MVVTDLLAVRQAKEKARKEALRNRPRLLESRAHTAWYRDHHCCKCFCPISGGMSYVREVYATLRGLWVKKYHWPICPDHYFREEERRREEEEARQAANQKAA